VIGMLKNLFTGWADVDLSDQGKKRSYHFWEKN
jgi:bisphosphoglycerate-dependent phosphoglycerate mutase